MSLNEREIMMENGDKFLRYEKGSNCGNFEQDLESSIGQSCHFGQNCERSMEF